MPNLFSTAKAAPKAKAAKKGKVEVILDKSYSTKMKRFAELKEEMENAKAELALLDTELKTKGREEFLKLYEMNRMKPDSFNLVAGTEKLLFITQDKYLKVDEAKELALAEFPDKEIYDEKTIYSFNPEVLETCAVAVSEAIMNSKKLTSFQKENLLVVTTEKSIKKGLILRLLDFKTKFKQLFYLIEPVCQLKSIGSAE